jgi:hypothetical protein
MGKRFLCGSIGVFLLACAYQMLTAEASANWSLGGAGQIVGGEGPWWFTGEGQGWQATDSGWVRAEHMDLPVPTSAVKFVGWGGGVLITEDDDLWMNHGDGGGWFLAGAFPEGPVGIERGDSWGKTKSHYR